MGKRGMHSCHSVFSSKMTAALMIPQILLPCSSGMTSCFFFNVRLAGFTVQLQRIF